MSKIWIWIHKEKAGHFNTGVMKSRDRGMNEESLGDYEVIFEGFRLEVAAEKAEREDSDQTTEYLESKPKKCRLYTISKEQ